MGNSEGELEEDDTEWRSSFLDSAPAPAAPGVPAAAAAPGPSLNKPSAATSAHRVILHFDLDCFYAQVEMIRNPALREVPLGIQQKYIIVTCNYVARDLGLTKLMSVVDAKEKCPQLVLVKGEDLTHYREMSYKVTELLSSYCPLVERLGFDENFMDVTEMVERRLMQTPDLNNFSFTGHVYNHVSANVKASDHPRMALGSHIAAELREAIHSKLGLTGCAGIATNKLLAKLVSGAFKPNQQTTLLPENLCDIIGSLSSLRKVPGIGHQTAKRLQALGLVSIQDLQSFPLKDLVSEFGGPSAQRLKNLVIAVDDSPVTPTGPPQSLSDEDSFKKMSSTKDVLHKIQQLLSSLVERMNKDGRQPQTFRLTIRKYSPTNKWFSRESRQCPIPNHIGQKIPSGSRDDAVLQLVPLAMKLFHKMVDSNAAFHLTLINVCFSNLQTRGAAVSGKGSITSFFSHGTSPRKTQTSSSQSQNDSSQAADSHCMDHQFSMHNMVIQPTSPMAVTTESPSSYEAALHGSKWKQSSVVAVKDPPLQTGCSTARSDSDETSNTGTHRLPPNVDPEVFELLPEDIQVELLSPAYVNSFPSTSASSSAPATVPDVPHIQKSPSPEPSRPFTENIEGTVNELDPSCRATTVNHQRPLATSAFLVKEEGRPSFLGSSDCKFPVNVDPEVFSELPPDVQRELMSEWKQQKPVLKTPSSRKPGRMTKDRKAAGKGGQANSLLKYFKPT
ncbi:DNA polymerase iota isoform X2 [Hippoglossus stenolepis]|uniref:DNA polymerase iota isoform X2 n=1 Tax=Hippoglossus stenolepis TaxID=195615 RepID=UPI001FAFEA00|nr:DNA polymerase iota isoform X2 [Hippoglossus stenolepis]